MQNHIVSNFLEKYNFLHQFYPFLLNKYSFLLGNLDNICYLYLFYFNLNVLNLTLYFYIILYNFDLSSNKTDQILQHSILGKP